MKNMIRKLGCACLVASACACAGAAEAGLFDRGGFFVGCNYWARHAGMYMWSNWDAAAVEREVSELAKNGVEVMRVFPLWSDFQPLTGDCRGGGSYRSFRFRDNRDLPNADGVDPVMMERFRFFCDVAKRNDIRLIVGIVTGWMSGRTFVPEVFEEKNVLSDSEAIRWQTKFVRHFVRTMKDHPAIAAWDYGNECNCLGAGDCGQAAFYNWMEHLAMAIRLEDKTRPIVSGMHGLSTSEFAKTPIRLNGEVSDILCTHPYAYYVPGCGKEAFNTMRTELHPTAESILYRDLGGKPCFIEEVGNLGTSCVSDERSAAGVRAMLFSAWANDLKGCLWWCNSDQEGLLFPPYTLTANERELGLLRQDFSPKPVMEEMKNFQKFRASLPFRRLPAVRTDSVIVVPEKSEGWIPGFGSYLLARQAGLTPSFAGAEAPLPEAPLYIVASSESDGSYTYPAQCRIFEKAAKGATVLIFYSGASRFTLLRERAGVKVDHCSLSPRHASFALKDDPGRRISVNDRQTCRLLAAGAEILATAEDGNVMFSSFGYGKGRVFLVNAPIDRQIVETSGEPNGIMANPLYRVVRDVRRRMALRGVVEKDDSPAVVLTEHPAPDGSTIVMAINCEPTEQVCRISLNGKLGRIWRGAVSADTIRLAPNEVALFEVR